MMDLPDGGWNVGAEDDVGAPGRGTAIRRFLNTQQAGVEETVGTPAEVHVGDLDCDDIRPRVQEAPGNRDLEGLVAVVLRAPPFVTPFHGRSPAGIAGLDRRIPLIQSLKPSS